MNDTPLSFALGLVVASCGLAFVGWCYVVRSLMGAWVETVDGDE